MNPQKPKLARTKRGKKHKRCHHFDDYCTKYHCKNDKSMGKFKGEKVSHLGFYGYVVSLNGKIWQAI